MNLTDLKSFQAYWVGKRFQCIKTGETKEIPAGVDFHDIITVGEGFLDLGDGIVARMRGVREVTLGGLTKRTYDKDLT